MTNLSISQLPAATTITGTELIPIVQGGENVKALASALAGTGSTGPTGATGATGPAGPNILSTSTTTALSGILYGNGANVEADVNLQWNPSTFTMNTYNLMLNQVQTLTDLWGLNSTGTLFGGFGLNLSWYNVASGSGVGGSPVAGLNLNAPGILEINNGTAGSFAELKLASIVATGNIQAASFTGITTPALTIVNVASNVPLTANATHLVNTSAARTLTFPAPVSGTSITIKDSTFTAATNNITLAQHASEKIENTAGSMALSTNGGYWVFTSNGTDWFLIG